MQAQAKSQRKTRECNGSPPSFTSTSPPLRTAPRGDTLPHGRAEQEMATNSLVPRSPAHEDRTDFS